MANFLKDGQCPRCDSQHILSRVVDAGVLFRQSDIMAQYFVCERCGYLEHYILNPRNLDTGWQPHRPTSTLPVVTIARKTKTAPLVQIPTPPPVTPAHSTQTEPSVQPPGTQQPSDRQTASAPPVTPSARTQPSAQVQATSGKIPKKSELSERERRYREMLMLPVDDNKTPEDRVSGEQFIPDPIENEATQGMNTEEKALYDSLFGAPPPSETDFKNDVPEHLREYLQPEQPDTQQTSTQTQSAVAPPENSHERLQRNRHNDNKSLFGGKSGKPQ